MFDRPRRLAFAFSSATLAAFLVLIVASMSLAEPPSVKRFVQMKWPVMGRLAPDGTFYYIHNPDGLNQLHARPKGAESERKLTNFPDGISGYSLSLDGKYLLVFAGVGGNEQMDLYLMDTSTGFLRGLYCHPDVVYGSVKWRRDSTGFAFRANDLSPSDFYVYVYDIATNTTKRILSEKGDYAPVDFSTDGKRLMVLKTNSATYSQLFEVEMASGKSREVTPAGQQWAFEPVGYAKGDGSFYAVSDYEGDKSAFVAISLADGKISRLFPQYEEFEADGGVLNEERTILAAILNQDGYGALHLHEMPSGKELPSPRLPKGIVGNIAFTGDTMLYSLDNANSPGLIYPWSCAKAAVLSEALTRPDTQGIDVGKFPLPELIQYKSFDGLEIPAFLYLPEGYRKGSKIPFVIEYHGGPEAQYRPSFNRVYQCLLSRGYGVMAPNVRGSSGYGKKYLEMDNYKKRMDSVRDGVAAARWLADQGYALPKQIASYGGSYGGFMVMATITEAPDAYGAACNVVGICNMQTFLERTKDYRRKLREVEYGPLSDPEFLQSVSPINKVDRIAIPLLIAHGENDPRVPVYEARQLYDKMNKLNKTVELLVFPDEGHGFRKEKNRITFIEKLVDFFDRHLKKQR